ncbi:peptidylprolyl isomerase [Paenibacillus sp. J31TS4]|uniref:peptidylprolyl isomerase n=1 Tax=Paenibacillus sp. J31TS4 TaxID=2807195 RepID=UPI001B2CFE76|nr:peptidylprolyl isomerase [Paenibacillus sp. J31TS4]GIP41329.1 peptidylprolyl isomerase [Paenibacillus sp. J31TS4]
MRNVKLLWGIIAVLLLSVAGLSVAAFSSPSASPSKPPEETPAPSDQLVAKIGNRALLRSELEEKLLSRYGQELLGQMIDRQVISMEADETGLKLSEQEIKDEVARMSQGYESEEKYYSAMKDQLGMTKEELLEDVRYKLLLEKLATRQITVTDKEIDDYLQAHKEEYEDTVQLRISQIINDTLDNANRTISLARNGRDFAELAKERSIDEATRTDGGDLGWLDENDPFLPDGIKKAARGLKKGEISPKPIPLEKGYAVIKLTDRQEISKGPKEKIRDSARQHIALQKAPPLREFLDELRKKRNTVIYQETLRS